MGASVGQLTFVQFMARGTGKSNRVARHCPVPGKVLPVENHHTTGLIWSERPGFVYAFTHHRPQDRIQPTKPDGTDKERQDVT
jgi:hypothetical protein